MIRRWLYLFSYLFLIYIFHFLWSVQPSQVWMHALNPIFTHGRNEYSFSKTVASCHRNSSPHGIELNNQNCALTLKMCEFIIGKKHQQCRFRKLGLRDMVPMVASVAWQLVWEIRHWNSFLTKLWWVWETAIPCDIFETHTAKMLLSASSNVN